MYGPITNQVIDYRLHTHDFKDLLDRVYSDPIQLLDRTDAPLLEIIGGLNKASTWGFKGTPGTRVEWLQEEHDKLSGVIAAAATAAATELTVDDASLVQKHALLRINETGEIVWVTAVDRDTEKITVTRGYGDGGVAAAAIAEDDTYQIVGFANLSGDDYYDLSTSTYWNEWNYSQIFQTKFDMSGTLREVPNQIVGIPNPWAREQVRAVRKIMQVIDRSLHYGVRSQDIGNDTRPRSYGGYPYFIKTNTFDKSSGGGDGKFTLGEINELVTELIDYGNTNPVVIASPKQYAHFKTFISQTPGININYDNTKVGWHVTEIDADFGVLKIIKNIRQPNDMMPIFSMDDLGMLTIRPLKEEELPKTADRHEWSVLGEYSFCLRNEKRHALFTGLSL